MSAGVGFPAEPSEFTEEQGAEWPRQSMEGIWRGKPHYPKPEKQLLILSFSQEILFFLELA